MNGLECNSVCGSGGGDSGAGGDGGWNHPCSHLGVHCVVPLQVLMCLSLSVGVDI